MSIGKTLIAIGVLAGVGGLVYACSGPINSALNDILPSPNEQARVEVVRQLALGAEAGEAKEVMATLSGNPTDKRLAWVSEDDSKVAADKQFTESGESNDVKLVQPFEGTVTVYVFPALLKATDGAAIAVTYDDGRTTVSIAPYVESRTYSGSSYETAYDVKPQLAGFFLDVAEPSASDVTAEHMTELFGSVDSFSFLPPEEVGEEQSDGRYLLDIDELVPEGYEGFADYLEAGNSFGFYSQIGGRFVDPLVFITAPGHYNLDFVQSIGGGSSGSYLTETE